MNTLTIVIPTYNEAENLPKLASALFCLPIPDLHLLIVDDHSPDGSGELADELARQYAGRLSVLHRSGKLGLGTAYIAGFQAALASGAQAIGQMDADFSHPVEKIPELYAALQTCDLAIGSRYIPGGRLDENWPRWRKALSAFGNWYARTILRIPVHDVTGGFRIYRRETLASLPLAGVRANGYAFQIETIYLTIRLGFSIKEIPFYFADRQWGKSKMSFAIQREAALAVWRMLWAYRHLKPAV
ncbi:MAG: polyprenol monophosphomannose synthase [Anaerolineales bacterium]